MLHVKFICLHVWYVAFKLMKNYKLHVTCEIFVWIYGMHLEIQTYFFSD